jgi:serine/threonine-protein kinase
MPPTPPSGPAAGEDKLGVLAANMALKEGLINAEQLRQAISEQAKDFAARQDPRRISAILVALGHLSPEQLAVIEKKRDAEAKKHETVVIVPPPPPPAGALGKYRLLRILGRGAAGIVYEAIDQDLQRRVALKLLVPSALTDPKTAAKEELRFTQEARLAANLEKHPNLVVVYDAGVLQGWKFIAMEFVEGRPMDEWRGTPAATLRQQIRVLRDVALGVHHAHERGILHRDLKPENILIDAKNQPRITDFGLAKAIRGDENLNLTGAGMTVGTPAYMSPEHARGEKEIDARTDVYSIGVLLYESLTGQAPFGGDSALEIMVKAVNEPVPRPSDTRRLKAMPPIDRALERICLKALAKEKDKRYATAKALADDLGRWLEGGEVEAAPRRAPRVLPWAVAAAAVLAAALPFAFLRPAPTVVPPPRPPSASKAPAGMEALGKNALGFEEYRNPKDDSVMILVPAGEFRMGSDTNQPDEKPSRLVTVDAFLIDKTEVTLGRFRKFVEATGYVTEAEREGGVFIFTSKGRERSAEVTWKAPFAPQEDSCPVTGVSYADAVAYCRWAGKRLPTEAEWEKAARGGDGRIWPWGNEWDPLRANAAQRFKRPVPVGSFPGGASPYGALDLAGSVSELVADWYDPQYYSRGETVNPRGPADGIRRIVKGGAWVDSGPEARATRRFARPGNEMPSVANGFRGARSLD